jgi:23S rRNA (uridine2552-2'-O)-methyltransferase
MTARGKSKKLNKAWLHDHLTDPYVKLAQREGYRARAAYKLKEIDEQLHLLEPGQFVVDLGAVPGPGASTSGASSVAARAPTRRRSRPAARHHRRPRHARVRADRRRRLHRRRLPRGAVLAELEARVGGPAGRRRPLDMAPNLSGVAASDAARMADLVELAIDFAQRHLRPKAASSARSFMAAATVSSSSASRRASDREGGQAEGVAGEVGRDLSGRNRPQSRVHPASITRE